MQVGVNTVEGVSSMGSTPKNGSDGSSRSRPVSVDSGKSVVHQSSVEFVATLQEIDEAINENFGVQISNEGGAEMTVVQHGKETDMEVSDMVAEDTKQGNQDILLKSMSPQHGEHLIFTTRWVDTERDKKR